MLLHHGDGATQYTKNGEEGWREYPFCGGNDAEQNYYPHSQRVYGNGFFGFKPLIDLGRIEIIDTEDISQFVVPYNTYYNEPIELSGSYFDMLSTARELQTNLQINANMSGVPTGDIEEPPISVSFNGTITGTFDTLQAWISPSDTQSPGIGISRKDTSTMVSRLDSRFCYSAVKNQWSGLDQEFTSPGSYAPPGVLTSFRMSNFYNARLFSEIHAVLYIAKERMMQGEELVTDPSSLTNSLSISSQNAGNASVNFNATDSFNISISIYIPNIVVTPSKIYAWVAVGGGASAGYGGNVKFSRVGASGYLSYEDVVDAGETSITFLGVNLPVFIVRRSYVESSVNMSLSGTSFNITKVSGYDE